MPSAPRTHPGPRTIPHRQRAARPSLPATRWRTVSELATEALAAHCKDLEIAAWLTEALLRSDGLIGLAAGSRLMAGLAENFWDQLFPHPDEEGVATRVAPIAGLNGVGREGTLIQPLRKLALFERPSDGSPFYLYQYEQSAEVARIADATMRQQRFDRGVLPFDVVESEARAVESEARKSGGAVFAPLCRRAAEAAEAWQALGQVLDRRAGADAPPTSQIRDLLEQIQDVAKRFATPEAEMPEEAATSVPGEAAAHRGRGARASGGWADLARGRTSRARPDRRVFPAYRASLANRLYIARGGAPQPHDVARAARGDRAGCDVALGHSDEPRNPPAAAQ